MFSDRPLSIKICCISSFAEAQLAIECGATSIGLVGQMPSGPGIISDELIRQIAALTPPTIATFLLTSETKAENIIAHHKKVNTSVIQIVDELQHKEYYKLRDELPGIKLVQVVHVVDESSIEEAIELSSLVDAVLLDSGNPTLEVKELGGTGRIHNWAISKEIKNKIDVPVILAGGLNADNVREAIETVEPFAVDLCSGVRTNGKLDKDKLERFMNQVRDV